MKKIFLATLAIIVTANLYAQKTVFNDANAEVRKVNSFGSISISSGIDLFLSQGDDEAVAVSASEKKYRDNIRTSVENGVLKIFYDNKSMRWQSGDKKMKAYVSFKKLERLTASGASDVTVTGTISVSDLKIILSGASDFKGNLDVNKLVVEQSGASDATLSGKVNDISIHASGASEVKAYELQSETCEIHASGASDVAITVTRQLSGNLNGASSINYRGQAMVQDLKTSGACSVKKKG